LYANIKILILKFPGKNFRFQNIQLENVTCVVNTRIYPQMKTLGLYLVLFISTSFGQDVVLTAPANLLSSTGLATPYQNSLNQSIFGTAAFVEATIFDPNTNNVYAYSPLVVTIGTTPAVAPTVPSLPAGAIVGLWFGTNANTLTLTDNNNGQNLANGKLWKFFPKYLAQCINGIANSIFGRTAFCNAQQLYSAVFQAINAGFLTVPPLGTASDGKPCPTSRDFFLVDNNQSDGVVNSYLVTSTTQLAQNTLTNQANIGAKVTATLFNFGDQRLLQTLDLALGCTPWKVRDWTDNNNVNLVATFATNEIQAS
jgi:hypothetical protein